MSDSEAVARAAAQLYIEDPDGFVERRRELAAAARTAGDADAAKAIAALRKPTRSAWTLNALARADAHAFDEVVALGEQLREAERRLDGGQLRELSRRRRELIDALAGRAFATTEQAAPSAALRDEVNATLLAAFADEDVAAQLAGGTLVRAAQWDGFGAGARPDLSVVRTPTSTPAPTPARSAPARSARPVIPIRDKARIADAEKEVAAARRQLDKAEAQARKHRERVEAIEEQLAAARRAATETSHAVREAKGALRQAELRLDRARG